MSLFAGADSIGVADTVRRAVVAEEQGFDAIWYPQTVRLDALTARQRQLVTPIEQASAPLSCPIQGRHPIPLAQQALTVADAAGPDRFTLGIGVGHPASSEAWYGIPYRDVVGLCEEELAALGPLLSGSRRCCVEGASITARIALELPVPPPGLVLAALGPRMLDLAGRLTDGTVTWMTGVRTIEQVVRPRIISAAASVGRKPPRIVVGLPVCVSRDLPQARTIVGSAMAASAARPSYRRMLAREGVDEPVDIALIGGEGRVAELIDALEGAGATELLANVLGTPADIERTREFLSGRPRVGQSPSSSSR